QQSNHPLAQAVLRSALDKGLTIPTATNVANVAGKGITGIVNGQEVQIGSLRIFEELAALHSTMALAQDVIEQVAHLEVQGKSTMVVRQGDRFLGILALADQPRSSIRQTLEQLIQLGITHLVMLTGDHEQVAQRVAAEIGLTDVRAGLLPEDKLAAI